MGVSFICFSFHRWLNSEGFSYYLLWRVMLWRWLSFGLLRLYLVEIDRRFGGAYSVHNYRAAGEAVSSYAKSANFWPPEENHLYARRRENMESLFINFLLGQLVCLLAWRRITLFFVVFLSAPPPPHINNVSINERAYVTASVQFTEWCKAVISSDCCWPLEMYRP
jgi:hypothetical protein